MYPADNIIELYIIRKKCCFFRELSDTFYRINIEYCRKTTQEKLLED